MRLPARPRNRRLGNRALRDLKRRHGLGPKTASWPMPSLRFNPTGFAPPTDTNLACARHEKLRCSIDFRLTIQDKNGLVALRRARNASPSLPSPSIGSHNSLGWVSKFPLVGLKNPLAQGIRKRRPPHTRRARHPPQVQVFLNFSLHDSKVFAILRALSGKRGSGKLRKVKMV